MLEFRRNREADLESFVSYITGTFPDTIQLFEYDDNIQYDADQENSAILANLLVQNHIVDNEI